MALGLAGNTYFIICHEKTSSNLITFFLLLAVVHGCKHVIFKAFIPYCSCCSVPCVSAVKAFLLLQCCADYTFLSLLGLLSSFTVVSKMHIRISQARCDCNTFHCLSRREPAIFVSLINSLYLKIYLTEHFKNYEHHIFCKDIGH